MFCPGETNTSNGRRRKAIGYLHIVPVELVLVILLIACKGECKKDSEVKRLEKSIQITNKDKFENHKLGSELSKSLKLGMTEKQVIQILGKTQDWDGFGTGYRLLWYREHNIQLMFDPHGILEEIKLINSNDWGTIGNQSQQK